MNQKNAEPSQSNFDAQNVDPTAAKNKVAVESEDDSIEDAEPEHPIPKHPIPKPTTKKIQRKFL